MHGRAQDTFAQLTAELALAGANPERQRLLTGQIKCLAHGGLRAAQIFMVEVWGRSTSTYIAALQAIDNSWCSPEHAKRVFGPHFRARSCAALASAGCVRGYIMLAKMENPVHDVPHFMGKTQLELLTIAASISPVGTQAFVDFVQADAIRVRPRFVKSCHSLGDMYLSHSWR
jgi:hypothetical protein